MISDSMTLRKKRRLKGDGVVTHRSCSFSDSMTLRKKRRLKGDGVVTHRSCSFSDSMTLRKKRRLKAKVTIKAKPNFIRFNDS